MKTTIIEVGRTIEEMLETAKARGVIWPRININGYLFRPAPATGRNAGLVYVFKKALFADKSYLGKISRNVFYPNIECSKQQEAEIAAILADTKAAITLHGQQTGTCCICGRVLLNGNSIAAMIGRICAEKYGFDIPDVTGEVGAKSITMDTL